VLASRPTAAPRTSTTAATAGLLIVGLVGAIYATAGVVIDEWN